MTDPIYLAQNGDFEELTPDQRRAWFRACAAEAKAAGATLCRATVSDDDAVALFEGWLTPPADQGKPRWQMSPERDT